MRPPPCGGFRGLSCGCAVLRGSSRVGLERVWVPLCLLGVHRPPGLQPSRHLSACADSDPPWTCAPLQSSITGTPRRSCRLPGIRDDASSPGLLLPYDTCRPGGPVCRQQVPLLPRTTSGVWLPPSRCPPPSLLVCQAHQSAHGIHPSRSSPHRDRCPSRSPCLLVVAGRNTPSRRWVRTTWSASRPSSRDESVLSPEPQGFQPSIPSWVSALQSFLTFVLARALIAAPPLSPFGRLDVQARLGHRVLRCERVGRPVSGPPALVGLSTFRRSRCSVRRSLRRAHGFASRPHVLAHALAIHAPRLRRNSRSRACYPAPAPIGLRSMTSSVRQCLFVKEPHSLTRLRWWDKSNEGTKLFSRAGKSRFTRALRKNWAREPVAVNDARAVHNVRVRALGCMRPKHFVENSWTGDASRCARVRCAMGSVGTLGGTGTPHLPTMGSPAILHTRWCGLDRGHAHEPFIPNSGPCTHRAHHRFVQPEGRTGSASGSPRGADRAPGASCRACGG